MTAGERAGSRFGQYELRRLLGVGGMGEVYEAYDTVRDRVVAVKLLDVDLARQPSYVERFRRESRTAAKLQEPHVIPVHDWGEVDGVLFIDMRMVDGRDLKAHLRAEGPLSPEHAVSVVEQVAAALDSAHASGLVHRDVKPANILLTGDMFAYLVDFGIAHTDSDVQLTGTGNAIGSFAYMAPERFEQHASVSATTDIYALTCVLFEALTGVPPFRTEGTLATIRAHMLSDPPRPSLYPGVPDGFDQVVAVGMAKDPARRYASAGQLGRAARAALLHARDSEQARTPVPGPALSPGPYPGHTGPQSYSGPQSHPGAQGRPEAQSRPGQPGIAPLSGPAGPFDSSHPSAPVRYPGPSESDPTVVRSHPHGQENYLPGRARELAPPDHPSAPLPLPPRERGVLPLLLGALIGVVLVSAAVLAWIMLSGKESGGGTDASPSAALTTRPVAATTQPSPNTYTSTTRPPVTTTLAPLVGSVIGTDTQGFITSTPRCNADDPAMAIGRTTKSQVVVCRTPAGRFYYKGVRLSDGAGIELDDPVPDGSGGFTATNQRDGTSYRITSQQFVITTGQGQFEEDMVEYAHR